jgi:catechol 2,3-dioxygenase-like lactoylglutathione lyase family enzyme
MNQQIRSLFQQIFNLLRQNLNKPFWIGLGIVLSFATLVVSVKQVALSTSVQIQNVLVQQQPQNPIIQLHHVTLSVSNAEQVSKWYSDVLGFKIRDRFTLTPPRGGKIQVVRVGIPGLQMNISQFKGSVSPNRQGERQGWRHLALQVASVDRSYQQLRAKGVQFLGEPFTYKLPGYRIAFFHDPEGNILELYQDL